MYQGIIKGESADFRSPQVGISASVRPQLNLSVLYHILRGITVGCEIS